VEKCLADYLAEIERSNTDTHEGVTVVLDDDITKLLALVREMRASLEGSVAYLDMPGMTNRERATFNTLREALAKCEKIAKGGADE
jgi:hypothetical protein